MKKLIILLIISAGLTSCEKALLDDNPPNDPVGNFESLWQTVNDKYAFFELKAINWDSVYSYYRPMVGPQTTDEELFGILDSMLYDLRDGHVNLVSPFDLSRNWSWYLGYKDNFDEQVMERYYLGDNYRIAGGLRYTIIDSVGYIYYGSFSSGFTIANLDAVMEYMQGTKGLIVDVRNNGGGSLNNAFVLASRLVQEEKQVLVSFEKTGPGPDHFGNGLSYTLRPSDHINYKGKVAVLINRRSYSATNSFAAMLFKYDHVSLIGDQTGGGGGIPIDYELPNGWRYRFSASTTLLPLEDENYYPIELGVPPNIEVTAEESQLEQGIDDIIETAILRLQ